MRNARYTMLAVCAFLAASVLLGSGCGGTPTPREERPREAAIPAAAVKMSPAADDYPPLLHTDEWEEPQPLAGAVNSAGAEDSPFITPDGRTLYFFFTPDVTVPAEKQLLDGVTGIYVARQQDGEWGSVERVWLQEPGKLALDGCAFVQESTMWFCSAREGYTGINWFAAQFRDEMWQDWQYVGFPPAYEVGELHITADGQTLYYHSPRPGGQGQLDIWVTRLLDGKWQPPENVTAVNSPEVEGWPYLTQDANELWFTRMYQGAPAIFRSRRTAGEWGTPELIVSRFAGEPTLDSQGNLYFVHHFYQDGQMVEADLYVAFRR
jgi:hypothetical protein